MKIHRYLLVHLFPNARFDGRATQRLLIKSLAVNITEIVKNFARFSSVRSSPISYRSSTAYLFDWVDLQSETIVKWCGPKSIQLRAELRNHPSSAPSLWCLREGNILGCAMASGPRVGEQSQNTLLPLRPSERFTGPFRDGQTCYICKPIRCSSLERIPVFSQGKIRKLIRMTLDRLETSKLLVTPKLGERERIYLIRGLSPDGKSEWDFHLDSKKVEFVKRVSTGAVHELSKNVPFVMREINALVFQGIRTDGHQEGLCYMGWPHRRFGTEGNELVVKDEDCFLVFINEERIIYNWRWETIPAKSRETFVPDRFAGRIR